MVIRLTGRFERSFARLTKAEMQTVWKAVELLADNPRHPGLQVKKMKGKDIWEARASARLRMTFDVVGDIIYMRHVGEHDKVLRNP